MKTNETLYGLALSGFFAFTGCAGADADPNEADADKDGVTITAGDCDDFNNTINPSATEVAGDGVDQNCDGVDDQPVVIDPLDVDDDGDGVTENDGDCDDNNNTIYPNAPELPHNVVDEDCDGEDGPTIEKETSVVKPFAQFATECETSGGLVQMHAACGGNNFCKGMSYGDWGDGAVLTEHSCRGLNYCNGWSCVVLSEDKGETGEELYSTLGCDGCHGWNGPDENENPRFTIMVNPSEDPQETMDAFWDRSDERFRSAIAFGMTGITSTGQANANMPPNYDKLSLAALDRLIAYTRTLGQSQTSYEYYYGDGSN